MTDSHQRKLKLQACLRPWKELEKHTLALSAPTIQVADAYERNLKRTFALAVFPPVVVNNVMIADKVSHDLTTKHRAKIKSGKLTQQEFHKLVSAQTDAMANQRNAILRTGGDAAKKQIEEDERLGFGILEELLEGNLAEGADSWLSAQIIGVWTAFEAMAEDLWVAALNKHPHGLVELRSPKQRGSNQPGKTIELKHLQKYGYDLSKAMGTILKAKYSFDRLEDIRQAYEDAFYEDADDILKVLSDKSLDALSSVRNLIVHNGGIIDESFLKRKSYLPTSAIRPIGIELQFDGELVASLIHNPIRLGYKLMGYVDTWLDKHAAK